MEKLAQSFYSKGLQGFNNSLENFEWNEVVNKINEIVDGYNNGNNNTSGSSISVTNGDRSGKIHITSGGNFEIETENKTIVTKESVEASKLPTEATPGSLPEVAVTNADVNKWYADGNAYSRIITTESPNIKLETDSSISLSSMNRCVWDDVDVTAENFDTYVSQFGTGLKTGTDPAAEYVDGKVYGIDKRGTRKKGDINITAGYDSDLRYVRCRQIGEAGGINLESDVKIKLAAPKVTLEGVTGFGSTMTFGETDEGIRYQYKATKKGNNKQCDVIQIEVYNNGTSDITFNKGTHTASNASSFVDANGNVGTNTVPTFCKTGNVSVPAGLSVVVAQASIYDIIQLVDWAKNNNFGPWQQ